MTPKDINDILMPICRAIGLYVTLYYLFSSSDELHFTTRPEEVTIDWKSLNDALLFLMLHESDDQRELNWHDVSLPELGWVSLRVGGVRRDDERLQLVRSEFVSMSDSSVNVIASKNRKGHRILEQIRRKIATYVNKGMYVRSMDSDQMTYYPSIYYTQDVKSFCEHGGELVDMFAKALRYLVPPDE